MLVKGVLALARQSCEAKTWGIVRQLYANLRSVRMQYRFQLLARCTNAWLVQDHLLKVEHECVEHSRAEKCLMTKLANLETSEQSPEAQGDCETKVSE